MSAIIGGLITYLETKTALTDLLADHVLITGKHAIFANHAPQKQENTPYLVIDLQDGEPVYSLTGDVGLASATLEIEVYASGAQGYGAAVAVKEQIRLLVSGWQGDTWGTVNVDGCTLEDLPDDSIGEVDDPDNEIHIVGYRADVWFNQTAVAPT